MPGPRFFAYCYRLPAYDGVLASVVRRQQESRAARATPAMSLGEWAAANPAAMQAAGERLSEGR